MAENENQANIEMGEAEYWKMIRASVDGRLLAYKMYNMGPVIWTHPDVPTVINCDYPTDLKNPNTYEIPDRHNPGHKSTLVCDWIDPDEWCPEGGWNWGTLHCEVESLICDGWLPTSNQMLVTA